MKLHFFFYLLIILPCVVCQQYETLLAEAKSGKESSIKTAVDKAIFSKTLELEYKWEKYAEEKRVVTNVNFIFSVVKLLGSSKSV